MASPGVESVMSLSEHRTRVVQSVTVDDYNHRTAGVTLLTEVNAARDDGTTAGSQYRWGEHHATPDAGKRVATLRHQAELARQVMFEGSGNVIGMTPGAVFRFGNRQLGNAEHGLLLTTAVHRASRKEAYTCAFTAIPSDRIYRPLVDESAKPKITGILPARVMSPDNYKYAYLTPQGWYRIQLPFDLDTWSPGGTSRPVRLAKPYAGRDYGHHYPLIDGTEVAIIFTGGDPDRPVIIGALHDSQHQDHVNNENHTRNIIRTAGKNELRMEDREGTEHVHLRTPFQSSELNLGHMVTAQREKRGEGAELRSDGHVAVRAAKGVLISADAQPNATGQQLDMRGAQSLLDQALQQIKSLADAARTAQAIAADYDMQKALLDDTLKDLRKAGVLVSAPDGMGLVSGGHLQLSADQNLIVTAGGSADIGVMKRFTVAAGELVSLFAQKLGMKLIAAKGKVEIQAQSDEMDLKSDRNLRITSVNGRVTIEAREELLLKCGGSYLRMSSTGIEDGTRGDREFKSAAFSRQGPSSLAETVNTWKHVAFDEEFTLKWPHSGEPLRNRSFSIIRDDGSVIRGATDSAGKTALQRSIFAEDVRLRLDPGSAD
jgi:type VI secretion system secreted protein VgrG